MFSAIAKTFMNQAPGSSERGVSNNIVAAPRSLPNASNTNSSRNAFETKAGNSNLIEILKKEGAKSGIDREFFFTENTLTSCLLEGLTDIKIFGSS